MPRLTSHQLAAGALARILAQERTVAAVFQQLEDTAQLAGLQLDQLGRLGVVAVRVGGVAEVAQLGVEQLPALVMFKHGLPIVYTGALGGDTMDTVTRHCRLHQ